MHHGRYGTNMFNNFFKEKKVLVTGHTGFKGAWLSIWLTELGANVIGYALDPPYPNSIFESSNLKEKITDIRADIKDLQKLKSVFKEHQPDIVIHLAAQSLLRKSYDIPAETYATNITGSINILECIREFPVKSTVLITSDKCYHNKEHGRGFIETDEMSTLDPYSTSKGCIEMITQSYRQSFNINVATARAGNVIGGGDWAHNRIVPDIIRGIQKEKDIIIRSPKAKRPWLFVLEPLAGYLLLAKKQYEGKDMNTGWNFGPQHASMINVKELATLICSLWGKGNVVVQKDTTTKKEATLLYLNWDKAKNELNWKPKLDINETITYIVDWYKHYQNKNVYDLCAQQIKKYEAETEMIHDVIITPLKKIVNQEGTVMHMLRKDNDFFKEFGEIYFSVVFPGAIKAWRMHKEMTVNLAAVQGNMQLVMLDKRENSPTKGKIKEVTLGEENYCLITIPPGIAYGFRGTGNENVMLANCATQPHDDNEVIRIPLHDIAYDWSNE
jgi:CDP-glucose 4,6-dehydratase